MPELISQTKPKARKSYNCEASQFLTIDGLPLGLTFKELRAVVTARKNIWKILKGEIYLRQCCKDGDVYTFRAIPEIHEICIKYDIYPET
jgi:hypothetical protein